MSKKISRIIFWFMMLASFGPALLLPSCKPNIDITAPPKDIFVVFGVLDATDTVQYIRVIKGFLVDGDAIQYAKENDISVKGLTVKLNGPSGKVFNATQVDNVPTDTTGDFYPYTTLYRIETKGTGNRLIPGEKYMLEVTDAADPSLKFEAYTYIPLTPLITTPDYGPGAGGPPNVSIPKLDLELAYRVQWQAKRITGAPYGYELRTFLYFENQGVPDTADYVSDMFLNGSGVRCAASTSSMCFEFNPKELIYEFKKDLPGAPGNGLYSYDDDPANGAKEILPKSLRFEVTGIDTFLTRYMIANNPQFTDFNSDKPEYTNLKGTKDVYGVFGSINKNYYLDIHNGYAIMDNCAEWLLGLNNTPQPANTNCQL